MSQLAEVVRRRFAKLENTRFGGDAVAGFLGFVFFSFTVGIEKLDPRNVGWLIFGDQKTHLLGWQFFASDQWHWPLGSNPMLGWEGTNSIVFTDSWPGLAILFKLLNIGAVDRGQYFGIGFLFGALALFIGARCLFRVLGLSLLPSLLASGILGTTPVFWWMQRWYPALSAGLPILVWALYFYFDVERYPNQLRRRWSTLFVLAASTHAYLVVATVPLLFAVLIRRLLCDRCSMKTIVLDLFTVGGLTTLSMFLLGYFTLSSKWAQTGGYGLFSANVLGLVDSKDASRMLPDLPSLAGQHEPTALGSGVLLLGASLVVHRVRSQRPFGIRQAVRLHRFLLVALVGLAILAVSNTVSIGVWTFRVPLPLRLEHALSMFRSSARFLWPVLIALTVALAVLTVQRFRFGSIALLCALFVQIVDSSHEVSAVAARSNGESLPISYDAVLWRQLPQRFSVMASFPADNAALGWAECSLAAAVTNRQAQCGYFSRLQGLDQVNSLRSQEFEESRLDSSVVYWVPIQWLRENALSLRKVYEESDESVLTLSPANLQGGELILIFSGCDEFRDCAFLGSSAETLGVVLRDF